MPAFRDLFAQAHGFPAPAPGAPVYSYPPPASGVATHGVCVNHVASPAKYACQGCGAAVCAACVRRYGGSTAVCTLCGQLCQPIVQAQAEAKRAVDRSSGFGLSDFGLALQYPFKDPIALIIAAVVYGLLNLVGWYGQLAAAGILFGYMSHAIRRVSMGHYDEGPSPDLSDPGELVFEAGKLGIAVLIVTYGPLVAVILLGFASFDTIDITSLASVGIGVILALLWAAFYYPMALLVAGYTGGFFSTINPIVGIATMGRLRLDYLKAYIMCLVVYAAQALINMGLSSIDLSLKALGLTLVWAVGVLLQYIMQGAVAFFASMVVAALLGLMLYKRPDVVDLDV